MCKRISRCSILVAVVSLLFSVAAFGQQAHLRIASYNIKFLDANESASRVTAIKKVIDKLDAHVIALQEIDDRAALEKVFDKAKWQLVIDDESGDDQDVAVAVRAPLKVVDGELNADDDDFLFWPLCAGLSKSLHRGDCREESVGPPSRFCRFHGFGKHW